MIELDGEWTEEGRGPRWLAGGLPRWPGVLRDQPGDRRTAFPIRWVVDLDVHGTPRRPAPVLLHGDGHPLPNDLPTHAQPVTMREREPQVAGLREGVPDRRREAPGTDDQDTHTHAPGLGRELAQHGRLRRR